MAHLGVWQNWRFPTGGGATGAGDQRALSGLQGDYEGPCSGLYEGYLSHISKSWVLSWQILHILVYAGQGRILGNGQ